MLSNMFLFKSRYNFKAMMMMMMMMMYVLFYFILFYFDRKAGVLLKETKVYITLVATPGVHSLVSPNAARSLIYDTSTKVGQCS